MTYLITAPKECRNCVHWGHMGLCRVKSGVRSAGGISWAQTVTTEPNDTCDAFHEGEPSNG